MRKPIVVVCAECKEYRATGRTEHAARAALLTHGCRQHAWSPCDLVFAKTDAGDIFGGPDELFEHVPAHGGPR